MQEPPTAIPVRSLRTQALLVQTKDMKLPEILRMCETGIAVREVGGELEPIPGLSDACIADDDFWKVTLERFYGNILIIQRPDIDEGEWMSLAKAISIGRTYVYECRIVQDENVIVPQSLARMLYGEDMRETDIELRVSGYPLLEGMTYTVVYILDEDTGNPISQFFPNREDALTWMLDYVMRTFGEEPLHAFDNLAEAFFAFGQSNQVVPILKDHALHDEQRKSYDLISASDVHIRLFIIMDEYTYV